MRLREVPFLWMIAAVFVAASVPASVAPATAQTEMRSAASVVKPAAYVSLEPVPRGKEFQIAVVAEIARGYHVNSHKPTDPYLIATTLTPQLPNGFQAGAAVYPPGKLEKFPFSPDKPLDVYSGSVTLLLHVTAQSGAPLGDVTLPLTLRYQACNDAACLPPVKIPVTATVHVADAGARSRAVHPEIFGATSQR